MSADDERIERVGAHAVNRVAGHQVAEHGDEVPRVLHAAFAIFNELHFGGRLGPALILVTPPGSPRAAGDYTPRTAEGFHSRIRLPLRTLERHGWRELLATLVHEMVHAACHELDADSEPGYKGHGPKFCARANVIGAVYGWPECAPRGRGGKAKAATWPPLERLDDEPAPSPKKPRTSSPVEPGGAGEDLDGVVVGDPEQRGAVIERERVVSFLRETACDKALRPSSRRVLRHLAASIESGFHLAGGAP